MEARVLLVDDDESILKVLQQQLEAVGCTIETADTVEEALSTLRTHTFDVVISDVRMNGNGLHVLDAVGEMQPAAGRIILTGYDEGLEYAMESSGVFRLRKPPREGELQVLIQRALEMGRLGEVDPLATMKQLLDMGPVVGGVASYGEHALAVFLKRSPDIAVLDWTMLRTLEFAMHTHSCIETFVLYAGEISMQYDERQLVYRAPMCFTVREDVAHAPTFLRGTRYLCHMIPYTGFEYPALVKVDGVPHNMDAKELG